MPNSPSHDEQRYNELKESIEKLDFIRRGSVVRRFMPCGKAGCRCQATPPKLHGPYYQWTRKVRGKTVTVRLTRQEATLIKKWIANGSQLTKIVTQMEKVSMRVTDRILRQLRKS